MEAFRNFMQLRNIDNTDKQSCRCLEICSTQIIHGSPPSGTKSIHATRTAPSVASEIKPEEMLQSWSWIFSREVASKILKRDAFGLAVRSHACNFKTIDSTANSFDFKGVFCYTNSDC